MVKRRSVGILAGAAALVVVTASLIWWLAPARDLVYGGHGLSFWLTNDSPRGPYWFDPELSAKYEAMHLDSAAVPYLRAAIRRGDTPWQRTYLKLLIRIEPKLPAWLRSKISYPHRDWVAVQHAIEMLPHVKPPTPAVVNELKRIVSEDPSESFTQSAIHALVEIGHRDPAGMDALAELLLDPRIDSRDGQTIYLNSNHSVTPRMYILGELSFFRDNNTNIIAALQKCVVDAANPGLQGETVPALRDTDPQTPPVTRALVRLMTNTPFGDGGRAATMLASAGIPRLVGTALLGENRSNRLEAIEVLGEVAQNYDWLLQIESQFLPFRDSHERNKLPLRTLQALRDDPDPVVKAAAIKAMASLQSASTNAP